MHLSKALDANASKTSCTSLVYGFMKLVHQGDNPNKELMSSLPERKQAGLPPNRSNTFKL